jgi:hypothetical protein
MVWIRQKPAALLILSFLPLLLPFVLNAQGAVPAPARRSAIFYYANETVDGALASSNYRALLNILRTDSAVGPEIESSLKYDAEHSSSIVSRDIDALKDVAFSYEMDLFVFTNTMAMRGEYYFADGHNRSTEVRPFNLEPLPEDPVLGNSPLSRSFVLVHALETALKKGPGILTDLFLIANTHGTDEFAMIPRVAANFVTANASEVAAQLSGNKRNDLSLSLQLSGTRKFEFWKAISDVSARNQVNFPLIFIESCESAPHKWKEVFAIPSSVAVIAHSGFNGLKPSGIDYRSLLRKSPQQPSDFAPILAFELEKSGLHVESRSRMWIWPLRASLAPMSAFWYFVPIVVWLPGLALAFCLRARRFTPKPPAVVPTFNVSS